MNGKHAQRTTPEDRQQSGFDRSSPKDWLRVAGVAGSAVVATVLLHHANHPNSSDEREKPTGAVLTPDGPLDARQLVESLEDEPMPQMVTYVLEPHNTKTPQEK
jgi:hypothetical protein